MTDRELMQQALDVLEDIFGKNKVDVGIITALRERLAQPETVMAEYTFQTYAAYKTPDGEMKIGVVPDDAPQRTHWEGCEEVHPECKKTNR
jgi:hypothetical protein